MTHNGQDTEQGNIHNQALLQALIAQREMYANRCAQLEAKLAVMENSAAKQPPAEALPKEVESAPKDEALG